VTYVLEVHNLSLTAPTGHQLMRCDRLTAKKGSIVGIIGPSGSGKTTLLRSMLGALPNQTCGVEGTLSVLGKEPLKLPPGQLRDFRRQHVGFVGQDPASRLNPRMRIGRTLTEVAGSGQTDVRQALAGVGLPSTEEFLRRRPGHLSGGQQRRVALARALVRRPDLLLLDEPTAGLDSALRDKLSELLRARAGQYGTTIVLACHDPSLLEELTDDIVDLADDPTDNSTDNPAPTAAARRRRPTTGTDEPPARAEGLPTRTDGPELLRVDKLSAWADTDRRKPILHDIELRLARGEALAVIGASGAGKTTLGRAITGLHHCARGHIRLDDKPLPLPAQQRSRALRRRIQLIPQDPLGTLNPSRTVGATLTRPLRLRLEFPTQELSGQIAGLLDAVGLPQDFARRYPHELSGGQRQRVAIARALAAEPDILVCDEVTSSLDPRTAAGVMDLLSELRSRRDLALIIISHHIPLVAQHSSAVLALHEGRVAESGPTGRPDPDPQDPRIRADRIR
jgi:peptide/nickel transport system ATP-binding protein